MRILIAIDESPTSEAALAAVSNHKWPTGSQIKLLYVIAGEKPVLKKLKKTQVPVQDPNQTKAAISEVAQNLQSRISNVSITYEVVQGSPGSQILKVAKNWKADLITMGTTNKKGIDKIILGSVSKQVLQKAQCPVLIIKLGAMSEHIKRGDDFIRILVASDGKPSSKSAFTWLSQQEWSEELVYKALSVIPEDQSDFAKENDAQKAAYMVRQWRELKLAVEKGLRADAQRLGKGLDNEYISVDVVPGNPKEKIVQLAKGWKAELIVTGQESKNHFNKLFLGSVSEAVAADAPCSVLVIKGFDIENQPSQEYGSDKNKKSNQYLPDKETRMPETDIQNENNPPFKMF